MREAFGSTFMFRIIIIFIVMYVTFATIVVSYGKVFRLKNRVVDILEQSQFSYTGSGNIDSTFASNSVIDKVDGFLDRNNYHFKDKVQKACNDQEYDGIKGQVTNNGACILPIKYTIGNNVHYYYRVTLYLVVTIPLLNDFSAVIPISSETEDFS